MKLLKWSYIPFFVVCAFLISTVVSAQTVAGDDLLGNWKADEKVLTIEILKTSDQYYGQIISFTDHHSDLPSEERLDERNSNPTLRGRKMIGMKLLYGFHFDAQNKEWSGGSIYDAGSGKIYSAVLKLEGEKLWVRAYKGFRFLGKSMSFHR